MEIESPDSDTAHRPARPRLCKNPPMLIARSVRPRQLSNSYLVADRPGGHAVVVDTGADPAPLVAAIREHDLTVDWAFLTHHHYDHTEHNAFWAEEHEAILCGHRNEAMLFGPLDRLLDHEDVVETGELTIQALFIPGHTLGQLAFLIRHGDEARLFTGDTLFRRSIGGTRGPGHTTHHDIKRSIMDRLMGLDRELVVLPGHGDATTLAEEYEHNPFVRFWRGLDEPLDVACEAFGEPATLLVEATDYDGGTKCILRWTASEELDVVPGSRVQR